MKMLTTAMALILASTLSSGVMAAQKERAFPEAGSNIDTTVAQNHIDVSHAFDSENLTAGNLQ